MARPGVPPSPLPPPVDWASPAEAAARKWLLWGAASVAGLVVLVGAWSLLSSGKTSRDLAASSPPVASPVEPPAPAPAGPALDARWIPDAPELLLRLEVATLEASGVLETIYQAAPGVREAVAESLFKGFGLQPKAVRRVTWASADLGDWTGQGVAVIELAEGQNAGVLRSAGEPLDWRLEGRPARRLNRPAWTLPYVVLDDRTIVTGEASLLGQLAGRGGDSADLGGLSPFFAAAPADADLLLGIDLSAARTAGWPLPTEWLDVWPEGKASWNLIWGMPVGLGVVYEGGDLSLMELALICEGHTAADKIRTALGQFSPQARSVLASRIDRMAASIAAGEIEAAEASRYELALRGSLAALESAEVDLVDICMPNFLHHAVAMKAVEKGRHIVCEKPLATTLEDGREIIETAEKLGKRVYYAEDWLGAPALQKALQIVREGGIGEVKFMRLRECHNGSHSPFAQTIRYCGGGCMIHLGVHPVGFMLALKDNR